MTLKFGTEFGYKCNGFILLPMFDCSSSGELPLQDKFGPFGFPWIRFPSVSLGFPQNLSIISLGFPGKPRIPSASLGFSRRFPSDSREDFPRPPPQKPPTSRGVATVSSADPAHPEERAAAGHRALTHLGFAEMNISSFFPLLVLKGIYYCWTYIYIYIYIYIYVFSRGLSKWQ